VRSNYQELTAYRLSRTLADDVREAAIGWPSFDRWSLGIQLVRAADSVGANIAEASGRFRFGDRTRFLHIARGSAFEVEHWVACAIDRGLLGIHFRGRAEEVIRVLAGLIRSQADP